METYCKVLIIDDEFIMRQGMKHMINWEKEGFRIVGEATNGQEGLDLIEKTKPDIVLADIVMPVLDGIDFARILQQRYPEIQLIILSSYDKFEYVKSTLLSGAVDYILKPTLNPDILLETLHKSVKNIPGMKLMKQEGVSSSMQIEKVLLGYKEKLDESVFAEVFPHTLYRIAAMDIKTICGGHKARMAHMEDAATKFFHEHTEYVCIPLFLQEELLCFVYNYRLKDEERVKADIVSCVHMLREMQEKTFCVVTGSFSGLQEIKAHYEKEVRPFAGQSFYYEGERILFIKEEKAAGKDRRFPFEVYTSCMMYRQFEQALLMFREYVEQMHQAQMDEYKMKNITKNLLYNYLVEMEKYDVPGEALKNKYFEQIDNAMYVQQFVTVMQEIFQELDRIRIEKADVEDERIMKIKEYIGQCYMQDLELADIAERFGFNYNYLSSYFNRQTKEGFSEYLNKVRVEKACQLLIQTGDTIADVSGQTGYSDHSYFCRVFKRITGETPSAYRREKSRKES